MAIRNSKGCNLHPEDGQILLSLDHVGHDISLVLQVTRSNSLIVFMKIHVKIQPCTKVSGSGYGECKCMMFCIYTAFGDVN